MRREVYLTLPMISVIAAIIYIYYSTVFVVIDDWLGLATAAGLMNAAAFTGLALTCVITYWMAVSRDPGEVPSSYIPDVENAGNLIHEIKRKGGDRRFCQKCSHHKPPRAHHCRVCKRCVLRMDHHCIWINNCVGHANYKIFFVFVFHAVVASIHSMILLLGSAAHDGHKYPLHNGGSIKTSYVICGLLLFPLTFALSILLGWHIYLVFHNKTTIEYHEGVRATWLAEKEGNIYRHPYDLGPYENLVYVLGPNILCWVCPTLSHIDSGLRFPTSYENSTSPVPPR